MCKVIDSVYAVGGSLAYQNTRRIGWRVGVEKAGMHGNRTLSGLGDGTVAILLRAGLKVCANYWYAGCLTRN